MNKQKIEFRLRGCCEEEDKRKMKRGERTLEKVMVGMKEKG